MLIYGSINMYGRSLSSLPEDAPARQPYSPDLDTAIESLSDKTTKTQATAVTPAVVDPIFPTN